MRGGPPRFPQDFTCPVVLGIPDTSLPFSPTGLSPSMDRLSSTIRLSSGRRLSGPTTPEAPKRLGFRLFPFRSPLLRKSRFLSSPSGTEMVHFPEFASTSYGFRGGRPTFRRAGLPHSEIPGSSLACSSPRLFAACHVLRRLSAPRHPPVTLSSLTQNLRFRKFRATCGLPCTLQIVKDQHSLPKRAKPSGAIADCITPAVPTTTLCMPRFLTPVVARAWTTGWRGRGGMVGLYLLERR